MSMRPDGVFEPGNTLNLFPTLVWKLRLKEAERGPLGEVIRARIARQLSSEHSLSQGKRWQSSADLQHDQSLQMLCAHILEAAQHAAGELHIARNELRITGCWAGVHARGAQQVPTSHANNYFTGLYWVQAPPGADTVRFHDPRPQTVLLRPPLTRSSRENALQTAVRAEAGTLLLFPAWLNYAMPPNESFESRVFVGFTLMFDLLASAASWPARETPTSHGN